MTGPSLRTSVVSVVAVVMLLALGAGTMAGPVQPTPAARPAVRGVPAAPPKGATSVAPPTGELATVQPGAAAALPSAASAKTKAQMVANPGLLFAAMSPTTLEVRVDGGAEFKSWRSEMVLVQSDLQVPMNRRFHWKTEASGVKGALWQVSVFPFPSDMKSWQEPPGLVGSGRVTQVPEPGQYAEFFIDFRTIPPGKIQTLKPQQGTREISTAAVSGAARSSTTGPGAAGQGASAQTATRELHSPAPAPASTTLSAAGRARATMFQARPYDYNRALATMLIESLPLRYYVRVVPLGTAGHPNELPSLPVVVTLDKPQGLPAEVAAQLAVDGKHPSVTLLSYTPLRFCANDAYNHFVVTRDIPSSSAFPPWPGKNPDWPPGVDHSLLYYKGQKLDLTPPPHTPPTAWEQFVSDCGATVDYFADAVNRVSNAYAMIKKALIDLLVSALGDWARGPLTAGLDVGLVALGIPPSIPNFSELVSMGKDYLVAEIAEQVGLPADVTKAAVDKMIEAAKNAEAGGDSSTNWLKPDPDFQYRPAQLMLRVANATAVPTDPVVLQILTGGKNQYLYLPKTMPLPSLAPGQSLNVPVFLQEYVKIDAAGSHWPEWDYEYYTVGQMKLQIWTEWQQGGYYHQRHTIIDQMVATAQERKFTLVVPSSGK